MLQQRGGARRGGSQTGPHRAEQRHCFVQVLNEVPQVRREVLREAEAAHSGQSLASDHKRLMVNKRVEAHPTISRQQGQPRSGNVPGRLVQPELELQLSVVPLVLEAAQLVPHLPELAVRHVGLYVQVQCLVVPESPFSDFPAQLQKSRVNRPILNRQIRLHAILPRVSRTELTVQAVAEPAKRPLVGQVLVHGPANPPDVLLLEKAVEYPLGLVRPRGVRPHIERDRPKIGERATHSISAPLNLALVVEAVQRGPFRALRRGHDGTPTQLLGGVPAHLVERLRPMLTNRLQVPVVNPGQGPARPVRQIVKAGLHLVQAVER